MSVQWKTTAVSASPTLTQIKKALLRETKDTFTAIGGNSLDKNLLPSLQKILWGCKNRAVNLDNTFHIFENIWIYFRTRFLLGFFVGGKVNFRIDAFSQRLIVVVSIKLAAFILPHILHLSSPHHIAISSLLRTLTLRRVNAFASWMGRWCTFKTVSTKMRLHQ